MYNQIEILKAQCRLSFYNKIFIICQVLSQSNYKNNDFNSIFIKMQLF